MGSVLRKAGNRKTKRNKNTNKGGNSDIFPQSLLRNLGGGGGFKEVYVYVCMIYFWALWGNDPVTQFHKHCPLRFDHIPQGIVVPNV